jgi:hypothetical protein
MASRFMMIDDDTLKDLLHIDDGLFLRDSDISY